MDPVDPKRRGRRLFGGRRRHELAAEAEMNESPTSTMPDAPASPEPPEAEIDSRPGATADSDGPTLPTSPDGSSRSSDVHGTAQDQGAGLGVDRDAATAPAVPSRTEPANPEPATSESTAGAAASSMPVTGDAATSESEPGPQAQVGLEGPAESAPGAVAAPETTTDLTDVVPSADGEAEDSEIEAVDAPAEDDEPESYELPRIMAIANQKGGVGKTTTSVNLGAALAEMGFRVLVVDLDPQGNATTGLGVNARELGGSIYDVIMNDAPVEDCVEPTSLKHLFVAPATIDLAGAEIELVPAFSRELKLRRALHEIRDDYDFMLIDCPPSLGLLTVNGLAAADDVIVPIQCEYYALEGLSQLIRNVSLVQKNLNPSLAVRGIVLTMYDARTKLADQVEQEVRNHFARTVYQTVIPRTVRLSEAPSFGQPIILFDPTSRGAVAYRELAKEVSSGATRRTG
jgi:chromosome partitioning protein